jgi:hypothetical protein
VPIGCEEAEEEMEDEDSKPALAGPCNIGKPVEKQIQLQAKKKKRQKIA